LRKILKIRAIDAHDVYPQNEGLLASVINYIEDDHKKVFDFVGERALTKRDNIGLYGPIASDEPDSDNPELCTAGIIGHLGLPAEHAIYSPFFANCQGVSLNGDKIEVFTDPDIVLTLFRKEYISVFVCSYPG